MSELVEIHGNPSWLAKYKEEDHSLDRVRQRKVLPSLQAVNGLSSKEAKELVGEGGVVIYPGPTQVCNSLGNFFIVPVFMFSHFRKMLDRKDKGANPRTVESTVNERSDTARKARNRELRNEPYTRDGNNYVARYVESLCFTCYIVDDQATIQSGPVVLRYERGNFQQGSDFCGMTAMRNVPLWAQVWEMRSRSRKNDQGEWWFIKPQLPQGDAARFINESDAEFFKKQHLDMAELYDAQLLDVDVAGTDAETEEETPVNTEM